MFLHSSFLTENFDIDAFAHVDLTTDSSLQIEFKEATVRKNIVKSKNKVYRYERICFTIAHKDLIYPDLIVFCDFEFSDFYVMRRETLANYMKNRKFAKYTNIHMKYVKMLSEYRFSSLRELKTFMGVEA